MTELTILISNVAAKGRRYTDARNALVAHALSTGVKQTVIVNESGLDKGDVSRVNSALGKLTPAQVKKVKGLDVSGMDADRESTLQSAVQVGESFFRRAKPAPRTGAGSNGSDTTKVDDVPAAAHEWLMASESRDQLTARLTLLADIAARAESEWTEPEVTAAA